ncbi:ABC transporter substrate-binding protein [Thermobifida halotolerans]|uniref:ABC transporter substrate-binding protein n=1 Tax=Thermobifida halotolerans TaxID=483545 RepID=A0A399G5U1_9ACTN|nr:ABC transporter substrate-binding protein [Thermobifida halotolerans]UOE20581.1 ABC transporter substrate-binding protein [Thermobifida halotolerans]
MDFRKKRGAAAKSAAVTLSVVVLATACGGSDSASGEQETLVVASWGAYFTEATRTHLADPFTEETGIEVEIVDAPGKYAANLEAQQQADNVQWDLLDSTSAPDAYQMAHDGLIQPLPEDLRTELEGVLGEEAVEEFGFTFSNLGYVIACNTEEVADCPDSQEAFFDTDAHPQRRQMISTLPLLNLSLAEMAAGVPAEDIPTHEIDMDRAFATLEEIKPEVKVWWESGDQMEQAFRNGEVDMGIAYSGRAFGLAENGQPIEVQWSGGVYNPGFWNVATDAPHSEAAFQFLEWVAKNPEAQAKWAEHTKYSVPHPEAFDYMDDEFKTQLADWPDNRAQLTTLNYQWYAENSEEVNRRWQEFLRG